MLKSTCLFWLVLSCQSLLAANPADPSVLEPTWFIEPTEELGFVRVAAQPEKAAMGAAVAVEVTFTCKSARDFLNPFWDPQVSLPGNVSVFDERQQFVGYLASGASNPSAVELKIYMKSGNTAGTLFRVKTGMETVTTTEQQKKLIQVLGPGRYFLQGFYTNRFLHSNGDDEVRAVSGVAVVEIGPAIETSEIGTDLKVTPERPTLGLARAMVNKNEHRISESVPYEIRYVNTTGKPIAVYNAFCHEFQFPRGGVLCVSITSDEPIGIIRESAGYKRWSAMESNFITLPPNSIVGNQTNRASGLGELKPRSIAYRRPPGEYYLRAVFTELFFAENFAAPAHQEYHKTYQERPVLVSEPIKFNYPGSFPPVKAHVR